MKKTLRTFIAALCVIIGLAIYPGTAARAQETPAAPTATFTVNTTADDTDVNPGNGVCETFVGNGVCTLRAAIMEANALAGADTISLPVGTYQITRFGDDDTGRNGDFDILDDLTINGTGLLYSIVDGNRTVIGQRVFHLVDLPIDFTLTLNRVTVRNGNGGIYNDRNRLNLKYCIVTTNLTGGDGGGIRNNQGVVNITFSQISDNISNSANGGAGIYNSGTLFIVNSEVTGNDASVNAGGISNSGGTAQVFVVNSTINDNQASQDGGALWSCSQCSATILASTVSNNTTFGDGAIYNAGGDLRIATSTLNNNITDGTGGALFNTGGNVTITNSTINDNQSTTGAGGGIANTTGGTMTLVGSTVNANEAGAQGGGVSTDGSSVLTLTNSTVSGNYSVWFGGGIYVEAGSTVNLRSATIASNVADGDGNGSGSGGGIASNGTTNFRNTLFGLNGRGLFGGTPDDCFGTITSQRYNLIQTTTNCTIVADDGSNLKNVNPLLAALADNGGPTRTRALQINSPAINTGNPAGCTDQSNLLLTGDQRGAARTGRCDIGAYEYQGCMLTGDLNDDRAVTVADIILAANDWNASPANYDPMTDLNGNGTNDAADIMIVSSQFGQSCP